MDDRGGSFLGDAARTPAVEAFYAGDLEGDGYVMNLTRVWAHVPEAQGALSGLMDLVTEAGGLTFRQRAVLVSATASAVGDSYCALAWGARLAGEVGQEVAAGVLRGDLAGLDDSEQALAGWARQVCADPNATTVEDVDALRRAGFDDRQIFCITTFVALRRAFSTVNDALGARPDAQLAAAAPKPVAAAVTFGRPPMTPG